MTVRVTGPAVPAAPPAIPPRPAAQGPARFGELVVALRRAPAAASPPPAAPSPPEPRAPEAPGTPLTEAGRRLLARVASGERYVESVVRQALHGAAFTPADLLAIQARVYRYTQDLELVSKLVDRAGNTVRTVMQQNG